MDPETGENFSKDIVTIEPAKAIGSSFIRQTILSQPGTEILPPQEGLYLPKRYDLSKVQEIDKPVVELALTTFVSFLSFPKIRDRFFSHADRENWRDRTYNYIRYRHGEENANRFMGITSENQYRRNKWGRLAEWLSVIEDHVDKQLYNKTMSDISKYEVIPPVIEKGKVIKPPHDPWAEADYGEKDRMLKKTSDNLI